MKAAKRKRNANASRSTPRGRKRSKTAVTGAYHHGALREALLAAAERILDRDGITGLTLRAAAREAGVSHAAPKHHFGDLTGLLSGLAAVGFERFSDALLREAGEIAAPRARMQAIGRGYVAFARRHPGLFLLMFRGERLDTAHSALRQAMDAAYRVLAGSVGAMRNEPVEQALTLSQAAQMMHAWSLVHGFAMLVIDGRLAPILARLPPGTDATALLDAIFGVAPAA
jgi:AcrR family transcriptional regulator